MQQLQRAGLNYTAAHPHCIIAVSSSSSAAFHYVCVMMPYYTYQEASNNLSKIVNQRRILWSVGRRYFYHYLRTSWNNGKSQTSVCSCRIVTNSRHDDPYAMSCDGFSITKRFILTSCKMVCKISFNLNIIIALKQDKLKEHQEWILLIIGNEYSESLIALYR